MLGGFGLSGFEFVCRGRVAVGGYTVGGREFGFGGLVSV